MRSGNPARERKYSASNNRAFEWSLQTAIGGEKVPQQQLPHYTPTLKRHPRPQPSLFRCTPCRTLSIALLLTGVAFFAIRSGPRESRSSFSSSLDAQADDELLPGTRSTSRSRHRGTKYSEDSFEEDDGRRVASGSAHEDQVKNGGTSGGTTFHSSATESGTSSKDGAGSAAEETSESSILKQRLGFELSSKVKGRAMDALMGAWHKVSSSAASALSGKSLSEKVNKDPEEDEDAESSAKDSSTPDSPSDVATFSSRRRHRSKSEAAQDAERDAYAEQEQESGDTGGERAASRARGKRLAPPSSLLSRNSWSAGERGQRQGGESSAQSVDAIDHLLSELEQETQKTGATKVSLRGTKTGVSKEEEGGEERGGEGKVGDDEVSEAHAEGEKESGSKADDDLGTSLSALELRLKSQREEHAAREAKARLELRRKKEEKDPADEVDRLLKEMDSSQAAATDPHTRPSRDPASTRQVSGGSSSALPGGGAYRGRGGYRSDPSNTGASAGSIGGQRSSNSLSSSVGTKREEGGERDPEMSTLQRDRAEGEGGSKTVEAQGASMERDPEKSQVKETQAAKEEAAEEASDEGSQEEGGKGGGGESSSEDDEKDEVKAEEGEEQNSHGSERSSTLQDSGIDREAEGEAGGRGSEALNSKAEPELSETSSSVERSTGLQQGEAKEDKSTQGQDRGTSAGQKRSLTGRLFGGWGRLAKHENEQAAAAQQGSGDLQR